MKLSGADWRCVHIVGLLVNDVYRCTGTGLSDYLGNQKPRDPSMIGKYIK